MKITEIGIDLVKGDKIVTVIRYRYHEETSEHRCREYRPGKVSLSRIEEILNLNEVQPEITITQEGITILAQVEHLHANPHPRKNQRPRKSKFRQATMENMTPGTQVAYIPDHADGDITHKDVELGFVTSAIPSGVFCRYWSKHDPRGGLRTKSCSEKTDFRHLVLYKSTSQNYVMQWMDWIDSNGTLPEPGI